MTAGSGSDGGPWFVGREGEEEELNLGRQISSVLVLLVGDFWSTTLPASLVRSGREHFGGVPTSHAATQLQAAEHIV